LHRWVEGAAVCVGGSEPVAACSRTSASRSLDEVRKAKRVIPDGDYEVRLEVFNPGLWAWRAAVRLRGEGYEIHGINEKGASGLYGGKVFERKWQLRCDNGV